MTAVDTWFIKGLPSVIRIGAFDISVRIKDAHWAGGERKWGSFSPVDQSISIQGDVQNSYVFLHTLMHELCHAIYWTHNLDGKDDEERTVHGLAMGWTQIIRDNPLLVAWLAEVFGDKPESAAAVGKKVSSNKIKS